VALSEGERALYEAGADAVPRLLRGEVPQEYFKAGAVIAAKAKAQTDQWLSQTYILSASGVWLDQHAIDRGTRRNAGENDVSLRARLRTYEDFLTVPTLEALANDILQANGITTEAAVFTLRRHAPCCTGSGTTTVTPQGAAGAATWRYLVLAQVSLLELDGVTSRNHWVVVGPMGSTTTGNATLTGTNYNQIGWSAYPGALRYKVLRIKSGGSPATVGEIAEVTAPTVTHNDQGEDNITDNFGPFSFVERGYRTASRIPRKAIVVILPYGTSATLAETIKLALEQRAGAGAALLVERRLNP